MTVVIKEIFFHRAPKPEEPGFCYPIISVFNEGEEEAHGLICMRNAAGEILCRTPFQHLKPGMENKYGCSWEREAAELTDVEFGVVETQDPTEWGNGWTIE